MVAKFVHKAQCYVYPYIAHFQFFFVVSNDNALFNLAILKFDRANFFRVQ